MSFFVVLSTITRVCSLVTLQLESFGMNGIPLDTSTSGVSSNANHSRSHSRSHSHCHSRNLSITSSFSANNLNQPSVSTSDNTLTTFTFPGTTNFPPSITNKRNSHHRRHSSVSTRTESAEIMGVSLPELPSSNSDNNVNLGDRDSIRRRALLALEGKPDTSFSKVEIPEIGTPDLEKPLFDFCMCLPSPEYSRMIHPFVNSSDLNTFRIRRIFWEQTRFI